MLGFYFFSRVFCSQIGDGLEKENSRRKLKLPSTASLRPHLLISIYTAVSLYWIFPADECSVRRKELLRSIECYKRYS